MSRQTKTPVFVHRSGYRQRRLRDAARLVPFLGLILWLLPLGWPRPEGTEAHAVGAGGLIYIFGVWVFLILCTALLAMSMRPLEEPQSRSEPKDE